MKKIILLLVALLLLAACAKENKEETKNKAKEEIALTEKSEYKELNNEFKSQNGGILLKTDKETYNVPVKEINFIIENTGSLDVVFGLQHSLEILKDNSWHVVSYKNIAFTQQALVLKSEETYTQNIPLDYLNGALPSGEYRVVKTFFINEETKVLAAKFSVK